MAYVLQVLNPELIGEIDAMKYVTSLDLNTADKEIGIIGAV